uniref:Pol polyprotein n=1 Tax=Lygus hesperus TaxID=30085 RepID=A0A0A9YQQ8_LYGHE
MATKAAETLKGLKVRRDRYWQQLKVTHGLIAKLPDQFNIFMVRCAKLQETAEKLEEITTEIEKLLTLWPELTDDTLQFQLQFDEVFYAIMAEYEHCKTKLPPNPAATVPAQAVSASPKKPLPKIIIPMFSGELSQFETFASLFEAVVHKNEDISVIEKFCYLKSSLSGEPLDLVNTIPYTATNYTLALHTLKNRYANPRIKLAYHFNQILNLQPVKSHSIPLLRELLNVVHINIEAIKRLKLPDLASAILLHFVLRLLDNKTRLDFEKEHIGVGTNLPTYDELISFLQNQCLIGEIANSDQISKQIEIKPSTSSKTPLVKQHYRKSLLATQSTSQEHANNSFSSKLDICKLCNKGSHRISKCWKFLEMPVPQRIEKIKSLNICMICLFYHPDKSCTSQGQCKWCSDSKHNRYLCHQSPHPKSDSEGPTVLKSTNGTSPSSSNGKSVQVAQPIVAKSFTCRLENQNISTHVLLGTASVRILHSSGQWYGPCRILMDSGSEVNFITDSLAQVLGLPRKQCPYNVTGIGQTGPLSVKGITSCTISSLHDSNNVYNFEAVITPKISVEVPSAKLTKNLASQFAHIPLADPNFYSKSKVDLLLGVQASLDILSHPFSIIRGNPSATQTIFGYVISGTVEVENQGDSAQYQSFLVQNSNDSIDSTLKKFWELEEVSSTIPSSPEDEWCENHFQSTIRRTSSGQYVASLPFKDGVRPNLGSNSEIALRRLSRLENRFKRDPTYFQLYRNNLLDYVQQGLAVHANTSSDYLLTHHGVLKESSTSPLRVVFNPSENCSTSRTLNSYLCTGPKLQSDMGNITLLFRLQPVALTCDVKGMFLAISLHEEDRRYQHFLFRFSSNESIQEWELTCLIFGMVSSPYIAQRVLKQLGEDEGHRFPAAAKILSTCCYVDNIVCSVSSHEEAIQLHDELTQLLASGCFILRKWASSDARVSDQIAAELRDHPRSLGSTEAIRVLGTEWDPISDSFCYLVDNIAVENPTKRSILSQIARIYDLNGYVAPVVFNLKLLLQDIWLKGLQWDDALPEDLKQRWDLISSDLPNLSQLRIPRYIMGNNNWQSAQLIGFGDASQQGMSAVLYLRVVQVDGSVCCNMIKAKTKIAPLKTVSIPRLELCASLLLSRLVKSVQLVLESLHINEIHLFTDSSTTLTWIHTPPYKLTTFVANRVVEITDNTSITSWRYVPTELNPADVASRGILASELISCELWWHGPQFLLYDTSQWPSRQFTMPETILELRTRSTFVVSKAVLSPILPLIERCSTFSKLLRVTVYVQRFIQNWFLPKERHIKGPMKVEELHKALSCVILVTQNHFLAEEIHHLRKNELCSSQYRSLTPFLSEEGFVMVGGRLSNSPLPLKSKHPLLMPHKSPLSALIIDHYHLNSLHGGPKIVQSLVQRYYWIPSVRQLIRMRLHKCITCFKFKAKPKQPQMADLPKSRFSEERCFHNTAIDFAGPFMVKDSNRRKVAQYKVYVAILVCMATKATHIELVSALSTEACLAALDRFIARRGLPAKIYSDRGRNFIGCARELKEMNTFLHQSKDQFIDRLAHRSIEWVHHPPYAPNFNGLVEAAVKSSKYHMKRIMGTQVFTYEEMLTLLARVEAVLNSRPLCPLSNSSDDDFNPLTPGHFLIGAPLLARPEHDLTDVQLNRLNRWQLVSHSLQSFWLRWRKEYLHTLMQRTKWTTPELNVEVGDMVLLYDAATSPLSWPLGRVEEVKPGSDGIVRVVRVRTPSGSILRPTNKVVGLPRE